MRQLGVTETEAQLGLIDYSRKEFDDFGNADIVERPSRATGSFAAKVDDLDVDEVARMLTARRAQPTVFIGTNRFGSALIYGLAKDWNLRLLNRTTHDLRLELEGLT